MGISGVKKVKERISIKKNNNNNNNNNKIIIIMTFVERHTQKLPVLPSCQFPPYLLHPFLIPPLLSRSLPPHPVRVLRERCKLL